MIFSDTYLIFGGTGSLGTTLVKKLLALGHKVFVFSRDEAKHHKLKMSYPDVKCIMGDIRDFDAVERAINKVNPDVIINAAAIKQVPISEEFPFEAVQTNVLGSQNLVKALDHFWKKKVKVMSISTDKACKPVNAYGMTKALQERIHLSGQYTTGHTHNCVRYGNVLESTRICYPSI